MNTERLQELIDLARVASPQRWRLGALAVVSATFAAVVAGFGIGPFVVLIVSVPAVIASVRPGSHAVTAVIVIVVVEWIGSTDDSTAPAAVAVALGLFAFHAIVALLAVTPHTSAVGPAVLRAWVQRSLVVAGATTAVWLLVAGFERNGPPTSAALTAIALTTLAAAAWAARARILAPLAHD